MERLNGAVQERGKGGATKTKWGKKHKNHGKKKTTAKQQKNSPHH